METSEGASLDDSVRVSFNRGHFFASGESSGTSTTSLQVEKSQNHSRPLKNTKKEY